MQVTGGDGGQVLLCLVHRAVPQVTHQRAQMPVVECRWFQKELTGLLLKLGQGLTCQDRERQGSRDRAYKDVFTASPGKTMPGPAPHCQVEKLQINTKLAKH